MKIVIIGPSTDLESYWDHSSMKVLFQGRSNEPFLSLPTLAAMTPREHVVELIDERVRAIDFDRGYDVVAISIPMTLFCKRAYEIADLFRKKQPSAKVLMGGPHVVFYEEETLDHCDAICVGEAESIWEQMLRDVQDGCLKRRYQAAKPCDLRSSPVPRYDLLARDKDRYAGGAIQTTRGCPNDCEFCSISLISGRRIRYKSPEQIVEEIKNVKRHFGHNRINILDDNFISNRKNALAILKAIEPHKVSWGTQVSINVADDPEMLEAMKRSGCFFLFIGFESLSDANIEEMNKKVNVRVDYLKAIDTISSYGIHVVGSFIIGLKHDQLQSFKQMVDFVNNSSMSWFYLQLINAHPKTRLYDMVKEAGLLRSIDKRLDGMKATIAHPTLSFDMLEDGFSYIYREISCSKNALNRLKRIFASVDSQRKSTVEIPVHLIIKGTFLLLKICLFSGDINRFRLLLFIYYIVLTGRANLNYAVSTLLLTLAADLFAQKVLPEVKNREIFELSSRRSIKPGDLV